MTANVRDGTAATGATRCNKPATGRNKHLEEEVLVEEGDEHDPPPTPQAQ